MILMQTYFDKPTQVKFWDVDGGHYNGGIAYRDEIICGDCGGIFPISEIYEFSEVAEPIIIFSDWIDLSPEIIRK